jgi:hypothetical protein
MELKTAQEVFDALGGTAKVAELTGVKYNAASNWKSFNRFPARTFLSLQSALEAKGLRAAPELWNMVGAG